ncbi:MAG: hypothetical protein CTY31_06730 [Hyphomicrobium sp.]|nr:MAG: hypothetical protein CTY39_11675 [Hyphomicrobium sp.]PPD00761.1 MAG: hypothetical protein CTY31_06730 [Hyphomicrobium sp.]
MSKSIASDNSGSIAIMSAFFLMVSISAAALAIDIGMLHLDKRHAQGAADLAAIAAASDPQNATAAARATLTANGIDNPQSLLVVPGNYTPDITRAPSSRFQPGVMPYNAAHVTFAKPGRTYFAQAFAETCCKIEVAATGASAALATFSIGSRLLAVRDGAINSLLGSLLGSNVALTVMDYNALADLDVTAADFLDALASELSVTAGTYDDVLNSSATVGDVIAATAKVSEQSGNSQAQVALTKLLGKSAGTSKNISLASLLDLGPLANVAIGDPAPGLDAKFKALDIITSAATVANGENQVSLDVGANIPGLLSLKLDVAIGEPPQNSSWAAAGEVGSIVRTAQTRLKLTAEVGGSGLLSAARIRLPIYLDLAYAEGRLDEIKCSGDNKQEATIAARPGIADVWIGEVNANQFKNFTSKPSVTKANIVDLPLIKVRGKAHVEAGNTSETDLTFTQADVDAGTIKRTDTSTIVESVVSSLLTELDLEVQILGIGIGLPGAIKSLVANTLATIAKPLDAVVYDLLSTLGVHVGEADVRVHGIRCGSGVLTG